MLKRHITRAAAVLLLPLMLSGCALAGLGTRDSRAPQRGPTQGQTPGQSFLMRGTIEDTENARILVRGTAPGDLCWITLVPGMPLISEATDGTTEDFAVENLATGMDVSIWHAGPVLESHPCQATGAYVTVHTPPEGD